MRENWEGLTALPSPVPRSVNEQPGADPVTPIITMAANGEEISSFLDHQVRKSYLQNIARVEVACPGISYTSARGWATSGSLISYMLFS